MKACIKNVLDKYNLKPVKTLRKVDGGSVRSHVIVVKHGNQKFCAKIFDSSDEDAKRRFISEIGYIKELKNKLPNGYKLWVPQIKWFSTKGENPFYVYKYIEGETIGTFVDEFGIRWGHFHKDNFPKFMEFLQLVSDLDIDTRKLLSQNPMATEDNIISTWGARSAKKELQYYFENVEGLLPFDLYDSVQTFYDRYQKRVFRNNVISHRDLYPENIVISKKDKKKFVFLDWEYLSYVPLGFDAAFFYLMFWKEEFWKARVYSSYYNQYSRKALGRKTKTTNLLNDYTNSFRFCLVILSIRFLYQLHTFGNKNSEFYEDAKASFIYDLQAAISGEMVKPRNIKFFLDVEDIRNVAKRYGIRGVSDYEIFYASHGNTVAKVVADKGTYIFRFYNKSRSSRLISRELRIFEKLKSNGISTYDVERTLDGELFLNHKLYGRKRKIAVCSYLEGRKIRRHWATEKAAKNAAKMLRNVHDCDVVHGDYSKENVLFKKTEVTGVIDFEWGRETKSPIAKKHDLAKAIALWLIDSRAKKLSDSDFIKAFIEGYYGKFPSQKRFDKLGSLIIEKIEDERDIYMTTIDVSRHKVKPRRFDYSISQVRDLMLCDKD